jgi:cysteinyl-tRNA synthetase
MDDDFNTPQALGALFELGSALHAYRERAARDTGGQRALAAGVAELVTLGRSLGLFASDAAPSGLPPEVARLVAARAEARGRREWRRADELREEIRRMGWIVEDTPAGSRTAPLET